MSSTLFRVFAPMLLTGVAVGALVGLFRRLAQ